MNKSNQINDFKTTKQWHVLFDKSNTSTDQHRTTVYSSRKHIQSAIDTYRELHGIRYSKVYYWEAA